MVGKTVEQMKGCREHQAVSSKSATALKFILRMKGVFTPPAQMHRSSVSITAVQVLKV